MPKFEVTKTVEAVKLNRRTLAPLGEPAVTLPYGAIIDDLTEDRDFYRFVYLMEPYRCKADSVRGALKPIGDAVLPSSGETDAAPAESGLPKPALVFENLRGGCSRAKVPGGWLVSNGAGLAFVPDPSHVWNGGSL
jgi:hypothetical protein